MCFVKTGTDRGTLVPVVSVKFFPLKILFSLRFSLERAGLETSLVVNRKHNKHRFYLKLDFHPLILNGHMKWVV